MQKGDFPAPNICCLWNQQQHQWETLWPWPHLHYSLSCLAQQHSYHFYYHYCHYQSQWELQEENAWKGRTGGRSKDFTSRESLSKITREVLANRSMTNCANPAYQKTSRGTWKGSQTWNSAFLQHFSKRLLSIAASRRQWKKRCSGGQE